MMIDSHQHFWQLNCGDYTWLEPSMPALYRDYMPSELEQHLHAGAIDGTVLVQAAATEAETRFMLDLARQHDFILGVVGWFDMEAEDAVERLESLIDYGEGLLKGVRPMIHDIDDPDWVLGAHLDPVFGALERHQLTFDALVRPKHLQGIETRLLRHPELSAVIDHGGKPVIGKGSPIAWRRAMASLASRTNAYCKLSGLVTEAVDGASLQAIKDVADDIMSMFGVHRVMWGSDWPVLNLVSSYDDWLQMAKGFCGGMGPTDQQRIFGGNAAQFYKLDKTLEAPSPGEVGLGAVR